ncbi:hypothetical protein RIF29_30363 [Crotalaria pallida]|uniref:Uncharacterized protein n=1 Tax=Crotalaria pallida TaxID=3830 RepID=A0AAN9EI70_CROPI
MANQVKGWYISEASWTRITVMRKIFNSSPSKYILVNDEFMKVISIDFKSFLSIGEDVGVGCLEPSFLYLHNVISTPRSGFREQHGDMRGRTLMETGYDTKTLSFSRIVGDGSFEHDTLLRVAARDAMMVTVMNDAQILDISGYG